ncbi:Cruciform DNA-recognizing protein 1 [Yarrowia sp. B02]|nr:Cruciform DNA-recognizing protein 1 [Yarrowia sp. B02]
MVEYTFEWPYGGSEVFVSGTFDDWKKSVKLDKSAKGHSKTVKLPKEKTVFKFFVDGVWKVDETAPTEKDPQGNVNNVLIFAEGDLHNHTQNIPGAFPGQADEKVTHDLKPSHLDPKAAHKLDATLETKREAVAGGLVDPIAATDASVPQGLAAGSKAGVTHDLKPSHLSHKDAEKLEDTLEAKHEAVRGGLVDPQDAYGQGHVDKAGHAHHAPPTLESIQRDEKAEFTSATIPAASTTSQNQPVTHDLLPSHLTSKQASKIENVLDVKQQAVDGGLVEPIDATGQSRAVPSRDVTSQQSSHAPHLSKFQQDEKAEFTTATIPKGSTSHPEPVTHDLKPSHLSHAAENKLEHTLETKKEAVAGGSVVPTYAENPIPAASTTSQNQPRQHDLQPSHLSHQAYDKLNSAVERKHDIIEDGKVSPVDSHGHSRAVPSQPLTSSASTSPSASSSVPLSKFQRDEKQEFTSATIPKASTSHPEPTTHDLQPSHLSHKAEQTLGGVLETKKEAVEGGSVVPTYAENPIPAASTTSQHEPRTHDLQPSHIGNKAEHKLDDNLAFKQNAVNSGKVDPDKL